MQLDLNSKDFNIQFLSAIRSTLSQSTTPNCDIFFKNYFCTRNNQLATNNIFELSSMNYIISTMFFSCIKNFV